MLAWLARARSAPAAGGGEAFTCPRPAPRRADLSPSGPGDAWGDTRDTACSAAADWHPASGSAATVATPPARRRPYRVSTPRRPASLTGPTRWPRRDPVACPRCRRSRRRPPRLRRRRHLPRSRCPRPRAPRPAGRNRSTRRQASPLHPVSPPRPVSRRRRPARPIRHPRCRPPLSRPRPIRRRRRPILRRLVRGHLRRIARGRSRCVTPDRPRPTARGRYPLIVPGRPWLIARGHNL
jgi:hypothetical protein